jgi:hypothetical protein
MLTRLTLVPLALLLSSTVVQADIAPLPRPTPAATTSSSTSVPNCWRADNPSSDIVDGQYILKYTTKNHSATTFAQMLAKLNGAQMTRTAVGSALDGATIEIDLQAPVVSGWRSSGSYPTFADLQKAAMASLQPVLAYDGVVVTCAPVMHAHPG